MNHRGAPASWADAASKAAFDCYELVAPPPDRRWAGGYGCNKRTVSSLEILHDVDGTEVSVATRHGERSVDLRLLLHEMMFHSMMRPATLELPITWTLEADDRTIDIDGQPATFQGVRIAGGDHWVGLARLPTGDTVTVRVDGPSVPAGIARCTNHSMPDTPG